LDLELDPDLDDLFWFSDDFTSEKSDFSKSESDEREDAEIREDAELLVFMERLQRAQQKAVEGERQRHKGKKRTRYTGNSDRTLWRHKATWRKIAQGSSQPFICAFFQPKASFGGEPDSNLVAEEQDDTSVDGEAELEHDIEIPSEANTCTSSAAHQEEVERLLISLWNGDIPKDSSLKTIDEAALNTLSIKDLLKLRRARAKLHVKSKDKWLDVFIRARITAMLRTLNLYLDPEASYTWRQASLVAAKVQGHSVHHAQNIRTWIHAFLNHGKLPLHCYGHFRPTILDDEDFTCEISPYLLEMSKNTPV
jgi:hypothetical protein